LAHRLRPRCRRCNAREEFYRAGIALRSRPAHKAKSAHPNADGENGCFSHVKIVTEIENQKAEVPQPVSYSEKPKQEKRHDRDAREE
jgi:hypothetical protein